jgi:hypothetical protein
MLGWVSMQCIAVYFLLTAAYSFVLGLWGLLVFLGGILFYGPVVVELDSFPERLGRATFNLIGPLLFGAVGGLCLAVAKRMRARRNLETQADDARAPVVYLRSFHVDKRLARRPLAVGRVVSLRTEEEQIAEALRELGPVVAVGRPGERLPRLGAQRVYVNDADWHQQILSWFKRAVLVVIHVPPKPTEGLTWEIEQGLSVVSLDRLVFLVSRDVTSLQWLNQKLRDHGVPGRPPTTLRRVPYRSRISGIIHFVHGEAEFRPLIKPPFFNRPLLSPLIPVFRSTFEPVTRRITGSWRPLPHAFGDALITAVWITFCGLVIAVPLELRRTDPLGREFMICGQHILKQLPNEARTFATNLDEGAQFSWMQSHIQDGLRYIPDDVVLAKADLIRRFLTIASPAECAGLADGSLAQAALERILIGAGRQDPAIFETWCSVQERTLIESLKPKHAETFPLSEADLTAAFVDLYETLSREDIERFDRIASNYEQASAEDHCWFRRTMLQSVGSLHEPSRSKLARFGIGQDVE